jgi:hypothetical protein
MRGSEPLSLEDAMARVRIATGGRLREESDLAVVAGQLVELAAGLNQLDAVMADAAQAPASATEPATIFRRSASTDGTGVDGQ